MSFIFSGLNLRAIRSCSLALLTGLVFAAVAQATIGTGLQIQLGNPSGATADPTNHVHSLLDRPQYALDYNDTTREANWVGWNLTTNDVGSSGRSPDFFVDPDLPPSFTAVQTNAYSGSGFDRGHMCPSADRTVTRADNDVTFYMSNMVPQTPDNNQGIWASFETYCRTVASAGNEILIISGPSGFGGSSLVSGVAIPGYTWKIAVVVPLGPGSALSRVTSSTRVITIKVPNIAGIRNTPWQNFVTSAAQIEADTGYTFFTALPASIAQALRVAVDGGSSAGTPVITGHPTTQTTVAGGAATFSVTATGDEPLSYQWLKDDTEILGATQSTFALAHVQASDAGVYSVVVSNAVGSTTSNDASLIVTGLPPSITTSPTAQSVGAGSNVTFSVAVTGSPTLTYQWRKDGVALSGNASAATATLNLTRVQSSDNGVYDVRVSNSVGFATSAGATLTVLPAAPTITGQPATLSAVIGGNASFTVTATGSAPFSYVWRKAGIALSDGGGVSGSTTATLALTNLAAIDAGTYDVVVSNALGSATSAAATLTVNSTAPSAVNWTFGPSGGATADPTSGLPADVTGGTVTSGNNNGTTALLTTVSVSSGYPGASGVNNAGAAARIGALNQAPAGSAYFEFTLTPSPGKQLSASGLRFATRSTGTGPQAFSIYTSVDGFAAPVASGALANNSAWTLQSPAFPNIVGAAGQAVTFRIYGHGGAGNPAVGTANWRIDDVSLNVSAVFPTPVAPLVTNISPAAGAIDVPVATPISVTFNEAVSFTGSWFSITSAAHGPIAATVTGGPTTFALTPPAAFAYNDTITVTLSTAQVVDQASGSIHGNETITFSFTTEAFLPPAPPTITTQPLSQSVAAGSDVSFTVTASGAAPLMYQWRKDGLALSGNSSATTATLTLTAVTTTDAGSYDCVVSNFAGSDVSQSANLTVTLVPPSITTQPVAQLAAVGGSATFTVTASGSSPLTYQWRKAGAPIPGANASTLTLTALAVSDSAAYDVVVTNAADSVTSSSAALVVTDAEPSTIYWDFATASPTSGIPANVTGGTITQGNNNGTTALLTTTSVSSGYTGASGGNNAGAAARIGGLNRAAGGSAFFEFTFTPAAGRQLAATGISFGLRSTGTGPQAYAVFSSADGFAAPLATGTVSNNSVWTLHQPAFVGVTGAPGAALTFRLYGYNGAGSPGAGTANWRIDDLKLTAGVLALPPLPPAPPIITSQPMAQTSIVGETVTFTVVAEGASPLTYQWFKDGIALTSNASAATATLTLTNVTTVDAGVYHCVVTNLAGSTSSAAAALTVDRAVAAVTLSNLDFIFDGTSQSATVTTVPAGLNVDLTYDGSATAPTNAGSYAVTATINDPNYTGVATGTLTIAKAAATVRLSASSLVYDGTPKAATATTNPAGLAVTFTYDGSVTPPTNVGSYGVLATVTNPNYVGSTVGTLVITSASATITLSDLSHAYDGTPKSATVTTAPLQLATTVTYDGQTAPPTLPGSYAVVATITDPNYTGSATGTLVITVTALVRHAPAINGGLDGSVQVLSAESMSLNSSAWISGDLLVPGLPLLSVRSGATYAGTLDGTGSASPNNHRITLNGGSVLRHVVRRIDAIAMPIVSPPASPTGTRNVSINRPGQNPGAFATLRNFILNSNVGQFAVPAGAYGNFSANSGSGFIFGVAGATEPSIYHLQTLTLTANSRLEIVGPVIINLANGTSINGSVGHTAHPEWLLVTITSGSLTLQSNATFRGSVTVPSGSLILNGNSTLTGIVVSDRLMINGNALLEQPE